MSRKGTLLRVDEERAPREDQQGGTEALESPRGSPIPRKCQGHHCVNLQKPESRTSDPHKGGRLHLAATEITHSLT